MTRRLDARSADFRTQFAALIDARHDVEGDVSRAVSAIIDDVRARGDVAIIELSARFDRASLTTENIRVSADEIERAYDEAPADVKDALRYAASRIEAYHRRQLPTDHSFVDETGATLGWRWNAIQSVGLYVPGGTAFYPSSLLMNAVPARVAGVSRLVMTTPATGGTINSLTLAAAKIAGISEIYRIGGAQAIAALAYGTETVTPVDKIVGPGNAYVAAAKRQVFGTVGIDSIAGPSEILVLADGANDPAWIAADLLSQAEHDPSSQSILITDDANFADRVAGAIERELSVLARREIAARSWHDNGAIIVVGSLQEGCALVDMIAPEHLEIATANPQPLFDQIRNAGAVFLGRYTPEAIGDYVAGPNHVLPTSRTARFSSGLSALDFMKRTSVIACDPDALAKLGSAAVKLAEAEGLGAHARSIAIRLNRSR